jgi:hypothetical protein
MDNRVLPRGWRLCGPRIPERRCVAEKDRRDFPCERALVARMVEMHAALNCNAAGRTGREVPQASTRASITAGHNRERIGWAAAEMAL